MDVDYQERHDGNQQRAYDKGEPWVRAFLAAFAADDMRFFILGHGFLHVPVQHENAKKPGVFPLHAGANVHRLGERDVFLG